MPVGKDYRVVLGEATETVERAEGRDRAAPADLSPSPQMVLTALKATTGADEVIKKYPNLEDFGSWGLTAYFSVCSKSGTAEYLDLWDTDYYDPWYGCLSSCRAWFSAGGFEEWGAAQTKTGRINCYFTAPSAGMYLCTPALQTQYAESSAQVECLIDHFSFGPLPFTSTIYQPHLCNLSAGPHHFRIRQMTGPFFFLSLSVWWIPVFAQ